MSTKIDNTTNKIVIIGGGMAGIAMGVQLKRLLKHENFQIYEKSKDIGGTWAQNTYPNLSCDVPSEFYSFSFFQSPDWTQKFANQKEILDHIYSCAMKFNLADHINLQQECLNIRWIEEEAVWICKFRDLEHSKDYEVKARYVITAVGVLNIPNGEDELPILKDYAGDVFHTAEWRETDFTDKRVMVIGNGCSANQVIPWILNEQKPHSLVQLVRSAQWVAPKNNYRISAVTKFLLRFIPFLMQIRRWWTARGYDQGFVGFRNDEAGNKARKEAADGIIAYMKSVANPKYFDILIPKYEFGAKRAVVDHGYLKATNHKNFSLILSDGIAAVDGPYQRTVIDKLGGRHSVDIVILANGFKTQDLLTPMHVYGLKNKELRKEWKKKGGAEAYMGVSVSDFPNFFMLTGPNTLPSGNSTLHGIECSVIYISRILKELWSKPGGKGIDSRSTIMPNAIRQEVFNESLQEDMKSLIYTADVNTWYINKVSGKNTLIYPGTQSEFKKTRCKDPIVWGDWDLQ